MRVGKNTKADEAFHAALLAATMNAARTVREKVADETLYAFALYTSGEDAFSYVCCSFNTEEALRREVAAYASRPDAPPVTERDLRWNACDWEWHDASPEASALDLPAGESAARDRRVKKIFFDVLREVDASGVLGEPRPTLALLCGDMCDAFLLDAITRLNPPSVVARYRAENTPAAFLDELTRLAPLDRLDRLLDLYRDLSLRVTTHATLDAQRRHVTEFVLEAPIAAFGPSAAKRLIVLAGSVADGPAFHVKGSDGWKQHGAFTREHSLATSAIQLAAKAGLSDDDITSLQSILARRIDIDRHVMGPVSLVPVVIARALHAHAPEQFPVPKQGASNNRLGNAGAFVL